jgi:hypothetical protein
MPEIVTPPVPVISGTRCVGFLRRSGREVEAFDRSGRSLGVFSGPIEAATAVEEALGSVESIRHSARGSIRTVLDMADGGAL